MIVATDAVAACRIALDVCAKIDADSQLPSARGAVGWGPVTARGGDVFGPLVNLVARATKDAPPGGVVATGEVVDALDPGAWSVEATGPRLLRGLESPVELYRIRQADRSTNPDP